MAYCAIAADSSNSGRALVEHIVAGVGFSVAGTLLIFAAVLLMENVMTHEAVLYGRRLLGQFTPLPIFALLCDGVYGYGKAYYGDQVPAWLKILMAGLLVLLLTVSVIGYVAYDRTSLDSVRLASGRATRGIAGCGLLIVTTCTLLVTLGVAIGPGGCSVPIAVVVAITVGGFLAAVGLSIWLFLSRPARPTNPVPAPSSAPTTPTAPVYSSRVRRIAARNRGTASSRENPHCGAYGTWR